MRLTAYTDYSLRTLMYLALNRDQLATVQAIADTHNIAKNHLTKVVNRLGQLGYIETLRGRSGGLRLARAPEDIVIGAVVRQTESDFYMAACFQPDGPGCAYAHNCALETALAEAMADFLARLDAVTLAQIVAPLAAPRTRGAPAEAIVQLHRPARKKPAPAR